jgi:tRNA(Ile)-lysidine synthase
VPPTRVEAEVGRVFRGLGAPRTVVAGLSGGADSVALLHALATRGRLRVIAAHLDHGLRPGSREDAAFCRRLCRALGVPFRSARADVRARAARDGGGLEEAARDERRAFLEKVRAAEGADAILLAHTRDDQAETVLLRLLRGSGSAGLGAMRARAGAVLRPMLRVSRADVLDHLSAHGLQWREDPSNADAAILRNRVRHELIPYLEARFNPAVRDALARAASVLAEEADVLAGLAADVAVRTDGPAVVLSRRALAAAPRAIARLAVRRAVREGGGLRAVSLEHVDAILDLAGRAAPSGRRLPLPGGREAAIHFDEVRIAPARPAAVSYDAVLDVPGRAPLPDGRVVVARPTRGPGPAATGVPAGTLVVRNRRPGDRVRAAGREMSLRRFLMDRRVPAADRDRVPLVACGRTIVWIAGQRLDAMKHPARHVRLTLARGAARPRK